MVKIPKLRNLRGTIFRKQDEMNTCRVDTDKFLYFRQTPI